MKITTATLTGAAASLLLLAGCGHGNYVEEGISLAQQKMATLKAATEYDQAEQAFLSGDLDKALDKVDLSIRITDEVAKSHVLRARILMERGSMGDAAQSIDMALELDEEFVDAHYYFGVLAERLRRHEDAAEAFMKAAELDPFNPQYAIAAGEMLVDVGRVEEAESFLLNHSTSEQSPGVRQLLGHIAIMADNADLAAERFGEARLLSPDDDALVEELCHALIRAGRFAEAEYNLGELIREHEGDLRRDLVSARAECLVEMGRPIEAGNLYRTLTRGPAGRSDSQAWIGLGRTAYLTGEMDELRRASSAAIAAAPRSPEGYALRALWQRGSGDIQGAARSITDGFRKAGEAPELRAIQGLLLADMGRHDEAAKVLAQVAGERAADRMLQSPQLPTVGVTSVPVDQ